jgi:hypothetical protein
MTSISVTRPHRNIQTTLRRLRSNVDAVSIGVTAVGSVVQGCPANARQWPVAWSLWSPTMRRFEAQCEQVDSVAELDANITHVLRHILQRAQFADDLLQFYDVGTRADEDQAVITRDAIQRLASACFVGRNVVGLAAHRLGGLNVDHHDRTIDRLLKGIMAGEAPCLDPTGALIIPGWAERRRHTRAVANDQIELRWRRTRYSTYVINRTAQGLGIVSVEGLRPDMIVEIATMDGNLTGARVVWVEAGKAGLELIGSTHDD